MIEKTIKKLQLWLLFLFVAYACGLQIKADVLSWEAFRWFIETIITPNYEYICNNGCVEAIADVFIDILYELHCFIFKAMQFEKDYFRLAGMWVNAEIGLLLISGIASALEER